MGQIAYVGDEGTIVQVEFTTDDGEILNISSATTTEIKFRKPDGTIVTKSSSGGDVTQPGGGIDGLAQYVIVANDFLLADVGQWRFFGRVVLSVTEEYTSSAIRFTLQREGD